MLRGQGSLFQCAAGKTIPGLPPEAGNTLVLCCTILCMQQLALNSYTAPCVGFCCDVQQIYPGCPKSITSGLYVFFVDLLAR